MADQQDPKQLAGRSYSIGNVGAHARVAQGENISWVEGLAALPDGAALRQQFDGLLSRIAEHPGLDDDTRELAQSKATAVAEGLAQVQSAPGLLRRALVDAKAWFASTASWVGEELNSILKSEAAQKTLGTVTEAGLSAVIKSFTGGA